MTGFTALPSAATARELRLVRGEAHGCAAVLLLRIQLWLDHFWPSRGNFCLVCIPVDTLTCVNTSGRPHDHIVNADSQYASHENKD